MCRYAAFTEDLKKNKMRLLKAKNKQTKTSQSEADKIFLFKIISYTKGT